MVMAMASVSFSSISLSPLPATSCRHRWMGPMVKSGVWVGQPKMPSKLTLAARLRHIQPPAPQTSAVCLLLSTMTRDQLSPPGGASAVPRCRGGRPVMPPQCYSSQ